MEYSRLTSQDEILELIRWHNGHSQFVVIDIETTGLDPFTDRITDIVLGGKGIDSSHIFASTFVTLLRELAIPVVAHNFKFDFNFLYRVGIDLRIPGLFADTMLLDHLLEDEAKHDLGHSLDAIVKRLYNDDYKTVFWDTYKEYTDAPEDVQVAYACKDVIYTRKILVDLLKELEANEIPSTLIQHVHELALVLYNTEIEGLTLDLDYLNKMSTKVSNDIADNLVEMRSLVEIPIMLIENDEYISELDKRKTEKGKAGVKKGEFNFDSVKQLNTLLYEKLKLPIQLNNKRKPTVDDKALENLELLHKIIGKIREYRGNQKLYTSFIEGSLKKMRGGRIYPSFNINGTISGRISSSNPNMQQLPKNGDIRGIYIPSEGNSLLSSDYSQLEVSLAAHFSRDENLLKIVHEGASQHDITAKGLGIDRHTAKTINFALQYGAGANKVMKILGCSMKDAEDALAKYWETYSGLKKFIEQCHANMEQGIPLVSPYGRQCRFPIKYSDKWAKLRAQRQGPNRLIQGTGADITSEALYLVNNDLKERGIGKSLFSVHDELIVEVKDENSEEFRPVLSQIMENVGKRIGLTVPLKAESSKPMKRWSK